jgi:hypothetical protein
MNSVKYDSPKANTIHDIIYLFCFSRSRLSFELIFLELYIQSISMEYNFDFFALRNFFCMI